MNGHAMYAQVQQYGDDDIVARHAVLVKRIAFHLINRLPDNVQVDDLIQAGMLGLLEASSNYNPSQGASFETFAGIRIRGAMLDEIRKLDWTPRSVHRKYREVSEAVKSIELSKGRAATDNEIAQTLGISLSEYHQVLIDSSSARLFSVDELEEMGDYQMPSSLEKSPFDELSAQEYQQRLVDSISQLPEKERLVMSLYYDDELNFREIGLVLEVSESRVCQIHAQAVLRIRTKMQDWTESN
ncbi:MAG: RNA polymerase sigma factor FliA [Gammaproteobacteria bacterium]|nr:RNA polymerase sigma factor FliA [Gammaproteobacteria bacterium]MBL7001060.1 RNA polymerase sigma factor FliA [Gammaproteobacteria bacterium]